MESFETPYTIEGRDYIISIFVTSKVSTSNIAGKTGQSAEAGDFMNDITSAGVDFAVPLFRALDRGDNGEVLNKSETLKFLCGLNDQQIQKMIDAYRTGSFKKAMKYLYKIQEKDLSTASRDQFVALAEEFYKRYNEALNSGSTSFEFGGGNFGFRPHSDVPLPFDI